MTGTPVREADAEVSGAADPDGATDLEGTLSKAGSTLLPGLVVAVQAVAKPPATSRTVAGPSSFDLIELIRRIQITFLDALRQHSAPGRHYLYLACQPVRAGESIKDVPDELRVGRRIDLGMVEVA